MRLRFLLSLLVTASACAAFAQQNRGDGITGRSRPGRADTVIIIPKPCPLDDPLACAVFERLAASKAMKPVPLAGQKEYFGKQNDYMNLFVRQYLSAHCKTLSVVQGRAKKQFSLIDNVLTKNKLPKELKYLAVIESALNNKALSPVGAYGPWQFMSGTAELMGLKVSEKKDERSDWFKSTNAAAKYLRYLYDNLNDWLLVIAAYNSGPVPVVRAIERTGSRNFWDIKKYLPRETQGHVLAFVATASIFEKMTGFIASGKLPSDFKFSPDDKTIGEMAEPAVPQFTDEELKNMAIVHIKEPMSFEVLYEELGMDKKLLNKWNPDYDMFVYGTDATADEDFYRLRIPKDKLDLFIEKKEKLSKLSKQVFSEESI